MSSYLLDTNIFIRFVTKPNHLNRQIRHILLKSRHLIFLSAISTAEIYQKISLNKLKMPADWQDQIDIESLTRLDFNHRHAEALLNVGWHHKDPFDRMLIAQATADNLTILTTDEMFKAYDVKVICNE